MPDFLRCNGIHIPLEQETAKRYTNQDASKRTVAGDPLSSRFGTRDSFSFTTILLTPDEGRRIHSLFSGHGDGASYRFGDAATEKGVPDGDFSAVSRGLVSRHLYTLNGGEYRYLCPNRFDYALGGSFFLTFGGSGDAGFELYNGGRFTGRAAFSWGGGGVTFTLEGESISTSATADANRAVASWTKDGQLRLVVNGGAAVSRAGLVPPVGAATVELYGGGSWAVLPYTLTVDDMRVMTNPSGPLALGPLPPPYLVASGSLISDQGRVLICEGRVVNTTWVAKKWFELELELNEVNTDEPVFSIAEGVVVPVDPANPYA